MRDALPITVISGSASPLPIEQLVCRGCQARIIPEDLPRHQRHRKQFRAKGLREFHVIEDDTVVSTQSSETRNSTDTTIDNPPPFPKKARVQPPPRYAASITDSSAVSTLDPPPLCTLLGLTGARLSNVGTSASTSREMAAGTRKPLSRSTAGLSAYNAIDLAQDGQADKENPNPSGITVIETNLSGSERHLVQQIRTDLHQANQPARDLIARYQESKNGSLREKPNNTELPRTPPTPLDLETPSQLHLRQVL
ncbi:hypothetical protein QFC21_007164 [Naganishia friedmannii]|uniref:Uncharacterized protein n=1 Tax=Naganishia friedmannii TaxID=89922 RepID=A0ACC2UXF4_9TREE|nr:hypothetical protein QFC21_007164 [Naganishia friedmannii]